MRIPVCPPFGFFLSLYHTIQIRLRSRSGYISNFGSATLPATQANDPTDLNNGTRIHQSPPLRQPAASLTLTSMMATGHFLFDSISCLRSKFVYFPSQIGCSCPPSGNARSYLITGNVSPTSLLNRAWSGSHSEDARLSHIQQDSRLRCVCSKVIPRCCPLAACIAKSSHTQLLAGGC